MTEYLNYLLLNLHDINVQLYKNQVIVTFLLGPQNTAAFELIEIETEPLTDEQLTQIKGFGTIWSDGATQYGHFLQFMLRGEVSEKFCASKEAQYAAISGKSINVIFDIENNQAVNPKIEFYDYSD